RWTDQYCKQPVDDPKETVHRFTPTLAAACRLGRHNLPVGGGCPSQSALGPDSRRRRCATGGTPGGSLLNQNRSEQRRGGRRALLDDAYRKRRRNEAENNCRRRRSIRHGGGGEGGKERGQHQARNRRSGRE